MSYVQIWLHCVWGTRNGDCIISSALRPELLHHISINAKENKITLDRLNIHKDHAHALINMGKQQNLVTIMQFLKGESSFWINTQKLLPGQFAWQDDYLAVSVSNSHLEKVRNYIKNQDAHHQNMSWEEELQLFIEKYGFVRIKD